MKQYLFTLAFNVLMFMAIAAPNDKVYITDTGKKYHMKNCSVAQTGKTGILRSDAIKKGYTACGVCKPDEKKPVSNQPTK